MVPIVIATLCGILALIVAAFMAAYVLKQDEGSEKVREISEAIKEGALAFLGILFHLQELFVEFSDSVLVIPCADGQLETDAVGFHLVFP